MEITGKLRKNEDKLEIVADHGRTCVPSSGAVVELRIGEYWLKTRIEYCPGWERVETTQVVAPCGSGASHAGHYYAIEPGLQLCEGLPARVTGRRQLVYLLSNP